MRSVLERLWARAASLPEGYWRLLIFAVALLVGIARRPEVLLRPAPILEGGAVFYTGTYFGDPLEILFRPYAGYQHLVVRLGAFAERLTDPAHAPIIGSVIALVALAGLAALVASDRLAGVVPDRRWRLALAAGVVLLPHTSETHGYLVDLPRYVPLYLLALGLAHAPRHALGRTMEIGCLALAGLSGPYALVMQPLFWYRAWRERRGYWYAACAVLALTAVAQVVTIAIDGRRPGNLDEPVALVLVALYRLTIGALLGGQLPASIMEMIGVQRATPTLVAVYGALALATLPVLWRLWRLLPRHVGVAWLFTMIVIGGASFASQREGFDVLAWPLFAPRYTVVPAALIAILVVFGAVRATGRLRFGALVLLVVMLIGWSGDARLRPFDDYDWAHRANACIGSAEPCEVPVQNPGTWTIEWPGADGEYVQPRPGA